MGFANSLAGQNPANHQRKGHRRANLRRCHRIRIRCLCYPKGFRHRHPCRSSFPHRCCPGRQSPAWDPRKHRRQHSRQQELPRHRYLRLPKRGDHPSRYRLRMHQQGLHRHLRLQRLQALVDHHQQHHHRILVRWSLVLCCLQEQRPMERPPRVLLLWELDEPMGPSTSRPLTNYLCRSPLLRSSSIRNRSTQSQLVLPIGMQDDTSWVSPTA